MGKKLIYLCNRQYLQETISQEAAEIAAQGGITQGEKISRNTLEEEARESSLRGHGTVEERYVLFSFLLALFGGVLVV